MFALNGLMWPLIASYGLVAFNGHGHVWPHSTYMTLCDLVLSSMAFYARHDPDHDLYLNQILDRYSGGFFFI